MTEPTSLPSSSSRPDYRVGVLSDTHGVTHPRLFELFAGVDLILHAGDVGNDDVLLALGALAPVRAVSGNVDGAPEATRPLDLRLTTPAGKIAVTHGHRPIASAYHLETMLAYFADFRPDIIVYGHTHIAAIARLDGVTFFNPGAAGRHQIGARAPSVGLITLEPDQEHPCLQHVLLDA
jgi:putative phosphoesterase